ncbi:DUF4058 family protein [Anaerolineales bacterium HSG24]|nr:DUF4058 family protein [Anaerolineales bacterium HSG24]
MPTPFPGMDPYLEQNRYWHQVHTNLLVDMQRYLTRLLRPRYFVEIDQRTYLAVLPPQHTGMPDVLIISPWEQPDSTAATVTMSQLAFKPITADLPMPEPEEVVEQYLHIYHADSEEIVTVIELLSPTNKLAGKGRNEYLQKRRQVLRSQTNMVEIDLLRAGSAMPMSIKQKSDYRIVVSRSHQRPQADIYLFSMREAIPDIPIPLRAGEPEPLLPLNHTIHHLYDEGGYDLTINYQHPPTPRFSSEDKEWARQLLETG